MAKTWKEVSRAELAKVPKGSPFSEYQKALKRASAVYHGVTEPARLNPRRRATRANPKNDDLVMLAVLAVGGYFAYQYAVQQGWIQPISLGAPPAAATVTP